MVVYMDNERKTKLLKYLFPTEEIRKFVCNDLFMELSEIIKTTDCISSKNIKNAVRQENKAKVEKQIKEFISQNPVYEKMLLELYHQDNISKVYDDVLIGYTFYLASTYGRIGEIDIFKDKKSICYAPISIIDIL